MNRASLLIVLLLGLNFITISSFSQLSGNYTINANIATGGSNFQSFTDFIDTLDHIGVSDTVNVDVVKGTGPYHERPKFTSYSGMSATNPIYINGNGAIIVHQPDTFISYIVRFDGAKHITINNIVIEQERDSPIGYSKRGIEFFNRSDSNVFKNSSIKVNQRITNVSKSLEIDIIISSSNHIVIDSNIIEGGHFSGISAGNVDNLTISNNSIIAKKRRDFGIILNGCLSFCISSKNKIVGNVIKNFREDGIEINSNVSELIISSNEISSPQNFGRNSGNQAGIAAKDLDNFLIEKNYIHSISNYKSVVVGFKNTNFGINIRSAGGLENSIRNNIIENIGSIYSEVNGIKSNGVPMKIYHNNITIADAKVASESVKGVFISSGNSDVDVKNNIISIKKSGSVNMHGIYIARTSYVGSCDYNNIYIDSIGFGNRHIGYYAGNRTNFIDWQSADTNKIGQHSLSLDPTFNYGVKQFNQKFEEAGGNVGVLEDFLGRPRDSIPDIGAIEVNCSAPFDIEIKAKNDSSVFINWKTWDVAEEWVISYYKSNLGPGNQIRKTIVDSTTNAIITGLEPGFSYRFNIRSNCNGSDTSFWNDTSKFYFKGVPLCGNYTINSSKQTKNRNFQSFFDLVNTLVIHGVSCSVKVDVLSGSGPYNEQVVFPFIEGSSYINTITVNGNRETISYAPTIVDRRVVGFDSAKHITLDSLRILGLSNHGYGIHFMNNADSNAVTNSIIDMSNVTNQAFGTSAGVISSSTIQSNTASGHTASYLRIENNDIIGDSSGGAFVGISLAGPSSNSQGNRLVNNVISNFYSDGISITNQEQMIISENIISRPIRNNVNEGYGIYIDNGNSIDVLIEKNSISNMYGGSPSSKGDFYGFYSANNDATISQPVIIQNNLVYDIKFDGNIYGFYNTNCDYINYYHNTVYIEDSSSTLGDVKGFYNTSVTKGIEFKNNIISISRNGSGKKHGMYINTAPQTFSCDYNNLDIDTLGSGGEYIAYYGGNHQLLTDWQSVNSSVYGQHSYDLKPNFVGQKNLKPSNLLLNNKGMDLDIPDDFYGSYRDSTPDIGAIEFDTTFTYPKAPIGTINGFDINGIADSVGLKFDLSGTVVGVDLDSSENVSFYIIDQSSGVQEGIHVFSATKPRYIVSEGDSLSVRGKLVQHKGLLSIHSDSISIIGNSKDIPFPMTKLFLDEATESKRVELTGMSVQRITPDGDYVLRKSSDSIYVHLNVNTDIDDSLNFRPLIIGDTVCSIIGIGTQEDNSFPFSDGYLIIPMNYSDLDLRSCQLVGLIENTEENMDMTLYPNPTSGEILINFNKPIEKANIEVRNSLGQLIVRKEISQAGNYRYIIDQPNGLYFVRVDIENGLSKQFKLVKQ